MIAVLRACRSELSRMLALAPVFSVLIVASVIYAGFYPQPYLNEALRNVPIAVVDQDRSAASRRLTQAVDASADVAVTAQFFDMPSAERAVFARQIYGILLIPQHFERDLLHGRPSPVAVYGDASYLLIYQRVAGAVSAVAGTMGAEVETARLIAQDVDPRIAGAAVDPMPLTAVPLFNPEGGYATYILPAAFGLIVQQILLIAVCLLGTLPASQTPVEPGDTAAPPIGAVASVLGRLLAYLLAECILLPTYLIALPYLYGLPHLGSPLVLMVFAMPFVLAIGGLGMVLARIFRHPLTAQLATAAIGLPLFFLTGFSWPAEAIPPALHRLSLLIPSTSAVPAFVRITQTGANLAEVRPEFLTLWGLAIAYGGVAMLLQRGARPWGAADPRPNA
ncbi:ABC transporter permease [Mesorhizobium sp. NZP2298]|uniref:ABC transporter permease n=1 Tax=Mesorhizobium sp. NZP2298 TaxID=2483403 RepID=UPI0015545BD2|nr:ABC transporter permease [Mesorhizobium sp. NZP2298]QKC99030.1 ABC transporter permease [Mesorhizobium sp. NZP2298]